MTHSQMNNTTMTKEERKAKVDLLFKQIAFIAEVKDDDHKTRDAIIKPLADELWSITQEQERLHELDHLRTGI